MKSCSWLKTLAFFLVTSTATFADEATWRRLERESHGDLQKMLRVVAESPKTPFRGMTRSAAQTVDLMKRTGRFQALGLTDSEGATLVQAVYRKFGLPLEGPALGPVASSERETTTLSFPVRAGTEFENLGGVLIRWPFDWAAIRDEVTSMTSAFVRGGVTVYIWVDTESQKQSAITLLTQAGVPLDKIQWRIENTDSVWMRDYGPQFLVGTAGPDRAIANFHYYDSRPNDDVIPSSIAAQQGIPVVDRETSKVVYTEGGNLSHDGLGGIIYSQRTYTKNRAPNALVDYRILTAFQAVKNTVLPDPSLDSTGHVDMFSKVLNANTVLVAQYAPGQVDYQVLEDAANILRNTTNGAGQPWNVVRIPQPDVYYTHFVLPVVRTYTNSQMANGVIVVPIFGISSDETALNIYRSLLPNREVVGLNANDIIEAGGAWHCISMEMPAIP